MQKNVYLPNEGLQGEDIPAHVIWEDMDFDLIKVSFQSPLKLKEVYNAELRENEESYIEIYNVKMDGYVGFLFESSKTTAIETNTQVIYSFYLSDDLVTQETKEICLFRPELEIGKSPQRIIANTVTGSLDNHIGIKNIGRGTVILYIGTVEDSPLQIETPDEQIELLEQINSDLREELLNLGKEYPQYKQLIEEILEWHQKDITEFIETEMDSYQAYLDRFTKAVSSDKKFLLEYIGAYTKVIIKNIEILDLMRRFVRFYESLVSKNVLLMNPFDEIRLSNQNQVIELRFLQTDKLMKKFEELVLPKIELVGKEVGRIAVYNLFGWE